MLPEIDPRAALPPMTAYYLMKCGATALVPYYRPGDPAVADAIKGLAGKYSSVLLANHGPVVSGDTLEAAVFAIEELEETAKLYLLLRGLNPRYFTPAQVADLTKTFGLTLPELTTTRSGRHCARSSTSLRAKRSNPASLRACKAGLLRRCAPRNDAVGIAIRFQTAICVRVLAARSARGLHLVVPPKRGSRECRMRAAPAVSCAKCTSKKRTRAYRAAENIRHSLRNGFTAYDALAPENRAFLPPSPAEYGTSARSGRAPPQDLTPTLRRQVHTTSPYASAPLVRTS